MNELPWEKMRWIMMRQEEMQRVLAQHEAVKAEYARLNEEMAALRTQVAPAIQKIPTPGIRRVMEMRYLQGMSGRAIAWGTAYTERHVFRLLQEGERIATEKQAETAK